MKSNKVSLRRRQVVIAGLAGAAAPATLYAGQDLFSAAPGEITAIAGRDGLVISGRVLAHDGNPLAAATIEIWDARATDIAAATTTDGDGRFYASVASEYHARPRRIHYRVSRDGQTLAARQLHFARGHELAERQTGHLHRDESGAWRAAFGVTVA